MVGGLLKNHPFVQHGWRKSQNISYNIKTKHTVFVRKNASPPQKSATTFVYGVWCGVVVEEVPEIGGRLHENRKIDKEIWYTVKNLSKADML